MKKQMKSKNPAAQALGRLGGLARGKSLSAKELSKIAAKGAKARNKALTADERSKLARKAVKSRWTRKTGGN
jgi:hypothetical protein